MNLRGGASLANLSGSLGSAQTRKSMLNTSFQSPKPFGNRMAQSSMTLNNFGGKNTSLSNMTASSTTNLLRRGSSSQKEPETKFSLTSTILIDLPKKPRKEKTDEWMVELTTIKPSKNSSDN